MRTSKAAFRSPVTERRASVDAVAGRAAAVDVGRDLLLHRGPDRAGARSRRLGRTAVVRGDGDHRRLRPQPDARERASAARCRIAASSRTRSREACPARATRARASPRATPWRSSTTTRSRVTTGWRSLIDPFADSRVTVVGGAVDPIWTAERPVWFPDEFGWVVGYSHRGVPDAEGNRAQPVRREHGDSRRGAAVPWAASGRASGASERAPSAARRRTSVSASCARAPRRSWCSSPGPGSPTTSRRLAQPFATSSRAATTKASRRHSWRHTAAPPERSRRSGGTCVMSCPRP